MEDDLDQDGSILDFDPKLMDQFRRQQAERRRIERLLREEMELEEQEKNAITDEESTKFIWKRKREQELIQGISIQQRLEHDKHRIKEAQQEIERIKKARELREKERLERDAERARKLRENDELNGSWEEYEQKFHLDQAKLRAQLRIQNDRTKPIDLIALNLSLATDNNIADIFQIKDIDLKSLTFDDEPYTIFNSLSLEELKELYQDISLYKSMETVEANIEFWTMMAIICKYEINIRNLSIDSKLKSNKVADDMKNVFIDKSFAQLTILKLQLTNKLDGIKNATESKDDTLEQYWTNALELLEVYRAKALLSERNKEHKENRLKAMTEIERARQMEIDRENELRKSAQKEILPMNSNITLNFVSESSNSKNGSRTNLPNFDLDDNEDDPKLIDDDDKIHFEPWMSPKAIIIDINSEEYSHLKNIPLFSIMDDFKEVCNSRDDAFNSNKCILNRDMKMKKSENILEERDKKILNSIVSYNGKNEKVEAIDGINEDEEQSINDHGQIRDTGIEENVFKDEVRLKDPVEDLIQNKMKKYTWQDKYRPRKPKYFNRVNTGYEWNQYNRTHYDTDNPPPKVVQGYKFNIFYPDLINKSKTPIYTKIRDEGYPETIILKFSAGPPYEDIAFRVINKEWDCIPKRGFKSVFDKGVLQLWFKFKKQRYRR